jgi:hypothetical protein
VLANGKLFVASIHQHTVYALDAASGRKLWQFSADGRVDSVPTYHKGNLLFGSAGGWVYCLRAADGALAWRYRAAPADDQIIAYNQLESRWPAKGTALVLDDVVYAAAGRNSYLDGGINLVGLDIATGKKLYEANVQNEQQRPAEDKGEAHVIDGAMLDILRSDGTFLFMQGAVFDKRLTPASMESAGSLGIYASGGFTDDLAWNRNAWRCGMGASSLQLNKKNLAGMTHTGQILVHDDKVVYGVKYFLGHSGQSAVFYPGDGYKLFAHRVSGPVPQSDKQADGKERGRKGKKAKGAKGPSLAACAAWELMLPVRVRAMTKAGNTLFIAGPPDVPADQDPLGALRGRKGAVLKAFSTDEGKELAELKLASPPVFDGLIAANGKLFMSTTAGEVICLGE